MKTTRWLFLLAVWTSGVMLAQSAPDAASSKILALETDWNAAYKASNVTRMNSLLADDFIITIEDGRTFSKSGYIAFNGNSTVRVELSDMTDMKVRMHGNAVAVVTGAYHEKGMSENKPYEYHDRFTDVWMMVDGRWQIIVSQYAIPQTN